MIAEQNHLENLPKSFAAPTHERSYQQRLDELEAAIKALLMAAHSQVEAQTAQRQFNQSLTNNLANLQQALQNLSTTIPRQAATSTDLKLLEGQLTQLHTLVQTETFDWKMLGGLTIAMMGVLGVFAGLVLYPTFLTFNQALTKQQRIMSNIFVCVIRPDTKLCADLRKSMDAQAADELTGQ